MPPMLGSFGASVFIVPPRLAQLTSVPLFWPAMPPMVLAPVPPVMSPLKVAPSMTPAFMPTMPPAISNSVESAPSTARSRIVPLLAPNTPQDLPGATIFTLRSLCPAPSNSPSK